MSRAARCGRPAAAGVPGRDGPRPTMASPASPVVTALPDRGVLGPLGAFAGFMDAAGGGGWGPISTPALLSTGRMEPRKVIGSVDTSEFAVAVGASAGFLVGLGSERIDFGFAGALLVGGLMGFLKAGSKVSLITSVLFAIILALFAGRVLAWPFGPEVILGLLLVVFVMRYAKTKKFMPAGLMIVMTAATLLLRLLLNRSA